MEMLEGYAIDRHVIPALMAGGNVREVAEQVGISTRHWRVQMEAISLEHHMDTQQGAWYHEDAQSIASRLGIESPELIEFLRETTADLRARE